ncbi:MurR/RpiR family transcriptional regulator [Halobacillus sp. SY10]|uniref:MurR/RpiR family transcriptional regulator n=1 Tax=Halobacillus sp. SY10 TaxID=3381356 RepID=UPI00387A5D45
MRRNLLDLDKKKMTRKQRQIADVIEKKDTSVVYATEQEIADEAKVSIASVSRFWLFMGYKNFREYKQLVKKKMDRSPENKMRNTVEQFNDDNIFSQLTEQHFKNLVLTSKHFDQESFQHAIQTVIESEKLFIHAPASSEGLGDLLEYRLKRFGLRVERFAKSGFEIYESMVHMDEQSTIVIFQFVDLLPETKVIFDYAANIGARTILITDRLVTDMKELADYTLYAHRGEMWEFHTMVSPVAVLEALVMGVGKQLEEDSITHLQKLSNIRKKYKEIIPK